ncbi:hypothetical protein MKX01_020773 [Papaver californicum]|nr:hypothetical protein MKX01_020773 [Papaver californicum]
MGKKKTDATSKRNLKLQYLDLYMIHYPITLKTGTTVKDLGNKDNLLTNGTTNLYGQLWKSVKSLASLSLIGVSNFSYKKIHELLHTANIPPSVNQVCSSYRCQ